MKSPSSSASTTEDGDSPFVRAVNRRIVAVLGCPGTGKTSLCTRFLFGEFSSAYFPSRVVVEHSKIEEVAGGPVMFLVRDSAPGLASGLGLAPLELVHAHCVLLVYRVDQPHTLEVLRGVAALLQEALLGAEGPPLALVGTHLDVFDSPTRSSSGILPARSDGGSSTAGGKSMRTPASRKRAEVAREAYERAATAAMTPEEKHAAALALLNY